MSSDEVREARARKIARNNQPVNNTPVGTVASGVVKPVLQKPAVMNGVGHSRGEEDDNDFTDVAFTDAHGVAEAAKARKMANLNFPGGPSRCK